MGWISSNNKYSARGRVAEPCRERGQEPEAGCRCWFGLSRGHSASLSAAVASPSPTPDPIPNHQPVTRMTSHATINQATRGATPDSETRVKDVVRHFSNLSSLPPPSRQRMVPLRSPRTAAMFTSDRCKAAPPPTPAPPPPPPPAPSPPLSPAPPDPRGPRQLRGDGDGVINKVETVPDG